LPSKNESEIRERATQLLEHLEIAESESHTHHMWDSGNFRWAAAVVREVLALLASRETPRQAEEELTHMDNLNGSTVRATGGQNQPVADTDGKSSLRWVRKFIEYARYELEPGAMQLGDQFPRQADADKAIAVIDAVMESGVGLIASERDRQMSREGWTNEHDDAHDNDELLIAAVWYLDQGFGFDMGLRLPPWPWERSWWKPSDDLVRNLVKAGALIAAEIDRLQRQQAVAKAGERQVRTCPRCQNDTSASDVIDGRCGECRLHEDDAGWADEAEGPLN
jgi:hypothetical protein